MARIDYFRFSFNYSSSSEQGVVEQQLLLDRFQEETQHLDAEGGFKTTKVYTKRQTTMQIFEGWGSACDAFLQERSWFKDNAHRLQFLRLDVRQELPSDADFTLYRAAIDPKTRKNVQNFNSRLRTKTDDRDAGGIGFSLGSHKSVERFIVYRRGYEQPAIEMMLRTKRLEVVRDLVVATLGMDGKGRSDTERRTIAYKELKAAMTHRLDMGVQKTFGCTLGGFVEGTILLDEGRQEALMAEVGQLMRVMQAQQTSFLSVIATSGV